MQALKQKIYLDEQPELGLVVKEFVESLRPSFDEGYLLRETEALECRRRDGFIPHSHNHGGYEKQYATSMRYIWGSGCSLVEGIDTDAAEAQYQEAKDTFIRHDASEEDKALFASLPEDSHNYHALQDLGHDDLAERMDEYCDNWMGEMDVWYGYRAMYEGKSDNGWHTLMIYVCANHDRYRGAFAGATQGQFEVKFRNADELKAKLDKLKLDIESVL